MAESLCCIGQCRGRVIARGWCQKHYMRWHRANPTRRVRILICSVEGCDKPHKARGFCRTHYARWRKNPLWVAEIPRRDKGVCSVNSCERPVEARGWCAGHYSRWCNHPERPVDATPLRTFSSPYGEGGLTQNGYRSISVNGVSKMEHRHIMECLLERPLLPDETVHHINGLRDDNRPENLELWSSRHPSGQRVRDKVAWALELLEMYPEVADEVRRNG